MSMSLFEGLSLDLLAVGLALVVILLVFVAFVAVLAFRYEQVIKAVGPTEMEQVLEARIASKQEELAELNVELDSCRDRLTKTPTLNAEIESLEKRRDDILAECLLLEPRREEIVRITAETEEALRKQTEVNQALLELTEKRTEIEGNIAALEAQGEELEGQREDLEKQVEAKRQEFANLDERLQSRPESDSDPLQGLATPLLPAIQQLAEKQAGTEENELRMLERLEAYVHNSGFHYPQRVIRAFHTAMKVNSTTQMAVLAGISGTGKSQLPRFYAQAMGIGFLQIPVQPRWDSLQDLMGFYNYIESRFQPTDLAKALYQLQQDDGPLKDRMLMILLDEMNLARVEYYFSDFLSRLENRPFPREDDTSPTKEERKASEEERKASEEERKASELELPIPMPRGEPSPRVFPGFNMLFAGTMNEDESTQSLSDKVIDRANVMRFGSPSSTDLSATSELKRQEISGFEPLSYRIWRKWCKESEIEGGVAELLDAIADLMGELHRPMGFRIYKAIRAYISNYPQQGLDHQKAALADQVEMRLLPKLRGLEIEDAADQFDKLNDFVDRELDDDALAQGIKHCVDTASERGGQFIWSGIRRDA